MLENMQIHSSHISACTLLQAVTSCVQVGGSEHPHQF